MCCRKSTAKTGSLLAAQIDNENWFAAGRIIQQQNYFVVGRTIQRKLFRYRHFNFDNECYFTAANTLSTMNANSLQATQFRRQITISVQSIHFRQRTLIRCRTTQVRQGMLIRCSQHTLSSEC